MPAPISQDTLLLSRRDVRGLLDLDECMAAVETAFRLYAEGNALPPKILGLHSLNGGLHIKAGLLSVDSKYFVLKANANFPKNPKEHSLPVIQGVIVLIDAKNGTVLAVMDSIEITIIRTGAATGVAAKYFALPNASTVTICGCGNQGKISLAAIKRVRDIEKVFAYDIDMKQGEKFAAACNAIPVGITELPDAVASSEVVVTATTSRNAFLQPEWIMPGTFIAAVGADSEEKQELVPALLSNKLIVDVPEQCRQIGEMHHGIKEGILGPDDFHADLGSVIAGAASGRASANEIIIFDSTGMALQDVVSASIVYERAVGNHFNKRFKFSEYEMDYQGTA